MPQIEKVPSFDEDEGENNEVQRQYVPEPLAEFQLGLVLLQLRDGGRHLHDRESSFDPQSSAFALNYMAEERRVLWPYRGFSLSNHSTLVTNVTVYESPASCVNRNQSVEHDHQVSSTSPQNNPLSFQSIWLSKDARPVLRRTKSEGSSLPNSPSMADIEVRMNRSPALPQSELRSTAPAQREFLATAAHLAATAPESPAAAPQLPEEALLAASLSPGGFTAGAALPGLTATVSQVESAVSTAAKAASTMTANVMQTAPSNLQQGAEGGVEPFPVLPTVSRSWLRHAQNVVTPSVGGSEQTHQDPFDDSEEEDDVFDENSVGFQLLPPAQPRRHQPMPAFSGPRRRCSCMF
jgi:hypothetical protein